MPASGSVLFACFFFHLYFSTLNPSLHKNANLWTLLYLQVKFGTECHLTQLILKPVLISRCSQPPKWLISHKKSYARPAVVFCFLYKTPLSHHLHFYAVSDLLASVLTHASFVLVLSAWTHRRTWSSSFPGEVARMGNSSLKMKILDHSNLVGLPQISAC